MMAASSVSPDRAAWRQAVADVAAKAKAVLPPAVNGRVESAVKLVLQGDVAFLEDGSVQVGSSDPTRYYHLVGPTCTCTDFVQERAPEGWCKHRIAAGIQKRVQESLLQPPAGETVCNTVTHESHAALPEAPASVNVHLMIDGRQVQLTLRDTDEHRLLARLKTVLVAYSLPQTPAQASSQGEGWCATHQCQMRQTTKNGTSWYSHRIADGQWCKGR